MFPFPPAGRWSLHPHVEDVFMKLNHELPAASGGNGADQTKGPSPQPVLPSARREALGNTLVCVGARMPLRQVPRPQIITCTPESP